MNENATHQDLQKTLDIAKAQKGVLYCVLANLFWPIFPPLFILILPFQIFFVYRLANLTKIGYPPIWVVGMFIPFINLMLLLLLAQRSSKLIREAGFEVRLFGANLNEIEQALERAHGSSTPH